MRLITLLFLTLACTCVRAQAVNSLPTIDDPQNADRIDTYTRGFAAAFRLDSLKTYFNDSTLAIISLLPTDTDIAATLASAQSYADANDDAGTDDQTIDEVLSSGNTTSQNFVTSGNITSNTAIVGSTSPLSFLNNFIRFNNAGGVSYIEQSGDNGSIRIRHFNNGSPINNFDFRETFNKSYLPLEMSAQQITDLANGTLFDDAVNLGQLQAAQTAAQNYADANDGTGTDDQTLQEVTDEGASTTATITAGKLVSTASGSPAIMRVDRTDGSGKALVLLAGLSGTFMAYDESGFFEIVSNPKADLELGPFTSRLIIDDDGNVGINESDPTERLDVNGSVRVQDTDKGASVSLIGRTADGTLTDASDNWQLTTNGDVHRLTGGVGIGTGAPGNNFNQDTKLHLRGSGSGPSGRTGLVVENTNSSGAANFTLNNSSGKGFLLQSSDTGYPGGAIGLLTTNDGLDLVLAAGGGSATEGSGDLVFRLGGYGVTPQLNAILTGATGANRSAYFGFMTDSPTEVVDVNGSVRVRDTDKGTAVSLIGRLADGTLTDAAMGTDDQTIDVATLTGTDLSLSLSGDGEATKVIDLSSLKDGPTRVTRTSNLTRTSASVATDAVLTTASLVSGLYKFKAVLVYRGSDTDTDLEYEIERTYSLSDFSMSRSNDATSVRGLQGWPYVADVATTSSTATHTVIIEGTFYSSLNNTIKIDWGGTDAAGSITMIRGSYLETEKID
jgi:hypothetical protein